MKQSISGRWRLGLALSLTTAVLWGAVPLAMVPLVASVDAVTISWFRFVGSGLMLLALIAASGNLRRPGVSCRQRGGCSGWPCSR